MDDGVYAGSPQVEWVLAALRRDELKPGSPRYMVEWVQAALRRDKHAALVGGAKTQAEIATMDAEIAKMEAGITDYLLKGDDEEFKQDVKTVDDMDNEELRKGLQKYGKTVLKPLQWIRHPEGVARGLKVVQDNNKILSKVG